MLSKKEKWDGKSRPSTNKYRNNFDAIFGQKEIKELDKETQDYVDSLKDKL